MYGACTQRYFGYGDLSNLPDYEDVGYDVAGEWNKKEENGTLPEGMKYIGSSLLLRDAITIRHYFKISEDLDRYVFTVADKTVQPKVYKDNIIYVEAPNILAKDLDKKVPVTINIVQDNVSDGVTPADGAYTLNYGVFSYFYAAAASTMSDSQEKLLKLAKSLYDYYMESYFYFLTR